MSSDREKKKNSIQHIFDTRKENFEFYAKRLFLKGREGKNFFSREKIINIQIKVSYARRRNHGFKAQQRRKWN